MYDGVEEFWVTIRETGSHTESLSREERQTGTEKASASFLVAHVVVYSIHYVGPFTYRSGGIGIS